MTLLSDIRFAGRSLLRRPLFAGGVIAVLGLGIGANTAVFTVTDRLVLRPLHVAHLERLVAIYQTARATPYGWTSYALYRELAQHSSSLDGAAASFTTKVAWRNGDDASDLTAAFVTEIGRAHV